MVLSCHGFFEGVAVDLQPCDVTCSCTIVTLSMHSPNISMLNGGWLFGCTICMSIFRIFIFKDSWEFISLSCVITCDCACAVLLCISLWQNDRSRMADQRDAKHVRQKGRARQRWDAAPEEERKARFHQWRETDGKRQLTLRLKMNEKLGFVGEAGRWDWRWTIS